MQFSEEIPFIFTIKSSIALVSSLAFLTISAEKQDFKHIKSNENIYNYFIQIC